jgi:hypothetical protein
MQLVNEGMVLAQKNEGMQFTCMHKCNCFLELIFPLIFAGIPAELLGIIRSRRSN